MAHNSNKPGREKRKPKKDKLSAKSTRGSQVIDTVSQRPPEQPGQ